MRNSYLVFTALIVITNARSQTAKTVRHEKDSVNKIICISGSMSIDSKVFIKYIADLTGKSKPKICYVPTASADNPYGIVEWYSTCVDLSVRPFVLRTFLNADSSQQTFEETILSMDAIVVGGGSTLNMLGIWKAQGIDTVLRKAYEKGIVLAGGSAGSLCWFTGGYSDSRPKKLTIIDGLAFLNYSHCPHYHSEPARRPLYWQAILEGKLKEGYACDDNAALVFINGVVKKSISLDKENNNYFISIVNGKIKEEMLPVEIIK
jgi:dipeptidase E